MRFKHWLLLTERPNAALKTPIRTPYGSAVIIDLRAEDWQLSGKDEQAAKIKASLQVLFPTPPSFIGRLPSPDGRYLYYDGSDAFNYHVITSPPAGVIVLDDLPIVGSWWDYVIAWDEDNNIVKQPKIIRPGELQRRAG